MAISTDVYRLDHLLRLLAAFGIACLIGTLVLFIPFLLLVYTGLNTYEAVASLIDPETAVSQLAFCFLGGVVYKFAGRKGGLPCVGRMALVMLLGFSIGLNLSYAIRYGFLFAVIALLISGGLGWVTASLAFKVIDTQRPVLCVVRHYLAPLLGAFAVYAILLLMFGMFYYLMAQQDTSAFSCANCDGKIPTRVDFLELSLMRMTSFSEVDIKAVSAIARLLTITQSIFGILLFATYISILLSLTPASRLCKKGKG